MDHSVRSATSSGQALIEARRRLDVAEASWLCELAAFDSSGRWADDGCLGCVAWLMRMCGMARTTAKERLRVGHALTVRPIVRRAVEAGKISYSQARAITRLDAPNRAVDYAMVKAAKKGATARELDSLVAHAKLLADQENPPPRDPAFERRGLRVLHSGDGLTTMSLTLPTEDAERVLAVLDTYLRHLGRPVDPVDVAPAGATCVEQPTWVQRRAGLLVDLLEEAVEHLDEHSDVNTDRFTVNVDVDYRTLVERAPGSATIGGQPVAGEAARRLACDAGIARVITDGPSTVLDVGRTSRTWSAAQRRAARHRFGGRCAVPGCDRRVLHLHHAHHWADGGATDLDNALPLCGAHHRLVHEGRWTARVTPGDPRHLAVLSSPYGAEVRIPPPPPARLAS